MNIIIYVKGIINWIFAIVIDRQLFLLVTQKCEEYSYNKSRPKIACSSTIELVLSVGCFCVKFFYLNILTTYDVDFWFKK